MDTFLKTLPKRHKTKHTGIYYKEIQKTVIEDNGNIKVSISKDKVYMIQYKDIDKNWEFKTIGKKSDGIREAYCKQQRTKILNATNLGEQPPIIKKNHKKEVITLDNIFQLYKKQKENESKDFIATEQKYKANILIKLGHLDIEFITTDNIIKFRKYLIDKKLADSTINGNITFIGTLFNFAIEEGIYTKVNLIKNKKLKSIKLNNSRDKYLNKDEVNELLEAIEDDKILSIFVKLALRTGGRLETILNIQKKDIDIENHTITLKDLKNNSTYTSFLSDDIISILKNYIQQLTVNSFIVGGELNKYATRTLQRKLQNIINELFNIGLDKNDTKNRTVIHTLRHTFASHLAINGTPIFIIKKLMDHSNIEQTLRYAKLAPDSGKDNVEGLYRLKEIVE